MKIGIATAPTCEFNRHVVGVFTKGLDRHGVKYTRSVQTDDWPNYDLFLKWARRDMPSVYTTDPNRNFIVMENGFIYPRLDKKLWPGNISYGFNGLNGRADFLNKGKGPERFEKVHASSNRVRPWNTTGEYILLAMQVDGDMSIINTPPNYSKIIENIRHVTDIPIVLRPHPREEKKILLPSNVKVDGATPLVEQLHQAHAVVSVNSNTSVEAVIHGVPVLNLDPEGSMTGNIGMTEYSELINSPKPDRTQWLNEMSWCQWFPAEIENGDAWDHLKTFFAV